MTTTLQKPVDRPRTPLFSSGPCAKRPGWSVAALSGAVIGRSHRSKPAKAKLKAIIDLSRSILGIPSDYYVGITPASDTGAIEMALWSLLGARGVDMLAWESFGQDWVTDVTKQLKLSNVRVFPADYGHLPDLAQVDWSRDVVFTWNGTTSGVRVPNGDWIASDRQGLSICDATSAAFAMALPWEKLDVTTWSWQKVLGGEGQHGMLVLSPRAVERLNNYKPAWPLPKLFRLTKGGTFDEAIFKGDTINTPSMIAVEDHLDGLTWAKNLGGLPALIARSEANLAAVTRWVEQSSWAAFLAEGSESRSCTSICLKVIDPTITSRDETAQAAFAKTLAERLEAEGVAFDAASYRAAPPGLRIWGGATVETSDIEALLPWLDWAYASIKDSTAG